MSNEEEILQMLGIKPELSWGDRFRIRIAKKHIHRAQRLITMAYNMTQKAKADIEKQEQVIKEIYEKWKK